MKKKIIAAVVAASLVFGMFGVSSAQPLSENTGAGQPAQTVAPRESASAQPTETPRPEQSAAPEPSSEPTPQVTAQASKEVKQTEAPVEMPTGNGPLATTPFVQEEAPDGITDIMDLSQITASGSYRLIQDTTLQEVLVIGAGLDVTIDLNGCTITSTGANFFVNEGMVRICDSVGGGINAPRGCIYNRGTVSISGGHYVTTDNTGGSALYNGDGATMVVENCVVNAVSFAIGNSGDCTINGGEFHSTSSNVTPNWAYCIKSTGAGARLTINNATVTGIQGGVAAVQGTVKIYGGNFSTEQGNSRSFYALYVAGENGEVSGDVYGGDFSSPKQAVYIGNDNTNGDGGINASACLNIHGGTFDGGNSALFKAQNTGTTFISGGTFRDGKGDSDIDRYVVDGYATVKNEDGSVSVSEKKMPVKNETTGKGYETLQAAIAELNAGDTLTLTEGTFNATANNQFRIDKPNVTIQGQGDTSIIDCGTYSASTQAGIFVIADHVTIKDVKIVGSSTNGNVHTLKVTGLRSGAEGPLLEGVTISNVTLGSVKGSALNIHGVKNAVVDGVSVEQAGKCSIMLAGVDGITISDTKTISGGWNADIGIMYATEAPVYTTPTRLTLGSGNTFANQFVYSERPADAPGGADSAAGYEAMGLGMLTKADGTWALMDAAKLARLVTNKTTGAAYDTIQAAVDAANAGDVLSIPQGAGTYDEKVTLTKAVTLEGPGDGSAVLTGGITLAGPFGDDTKTVIKGLRFEKSGIYAIAWGNEPNLNNVTIENNIFENIAEWSAAVNFNLDNKSAVKNLTIANNAITNVTGTNASGIWVSAVAGTTRITGNTISDTKLNSIQITGIAGGDVTISGNTLKNWDSDVAGGGRAMRLTANGNASMAIMGNSMSRDLAAGEDGAQVIKITELDGTLNAAENYWNAAKPDFSAVLKAYKTGGAAADSSQLVVMPYYADAALKKLVEYGVKNARSGEVYDSLQKAVNKAQDGDTLLLGNDCIFGSTTQTGHDEDNIGYGTYGSFSKSLTIRSEGTARTVTATSIITVNAGARVVLENVTVDGENRIGTSGINVQGNATLILGSGATVKGCATSSGFAAIDLGSAGGTGGAGKLVMNEGSLVTQNVNSGIWVEPDGTFEMNGGKITANNCAPQALSKQAYGLVISGGKAVINGGEISSNGANMAGGGVLMSKTDSTLDVNSGTISNNTKNGSIYVTAADCIVSLHDAVITGNSVNSYGSVGGSSSATNLKVNISGKTQITGNKYGGTPCNLKTSANMSVDITGLETGAVIGVTPYNKAAGYEVASARDVQSVKTECFTPDSALSANVSLVRIGNKLVTGYATTISAAGLVQDQFENTGAAPALQMQGVAVVATNNATVQDPAIGFVYYADDNGVAGKRLAEAPAASGTYWVCPVYDGSINGSYGASQAVDAHRYTIVTPVSGVSLNKTSISLEMNTKGQLSAAVSPADAYDKTITWASSNEAVVKGDKGMIVPVAPGTANITAMSYNGKSATCVVTVAKPPETSKPPVAPDMGDKTQVVVEPEVKDNTVDSNAVKDAIANAKPDEAVVVKVEAKNEEEAKNVKVSADVVAEAAKAAADGTGAKTVAFSMADASGNIAAAVTLDLSNGVDPDQLKDLNLGYSNTVSTAVEEEAKGAVPQDATVMFINLTHDGVFPCPITRMDKVSGSFKPGDTVYLYYAGASGLSEEQVLTVDANGYITYTITHASPYVISDLRSIVTTPENPGGNETPGPDNPGGVETPGTGFEPNDPDNGSNINEESGNPVNSDDGVKPVNTKVDTKTTTAPKTDDIQDMAPYLWLIVIAGGVITAGVVNANKRRKDEQK
ncbi:MAG: right-handed parallel beta-helix repeat-containing protein [Christensenella sp.]|uniref:Ig-like domain-containing protein n=1 Tax=Christensenella sp. TaxID=1935934 RepID=UPI002B2148EA|nr:Ig-like domain-containing protein [Christensenella sp.]MEA5004285.1 right-handed parallel beta-helix repeat-containing protein [Christensenella sp.]